MNKNKKGFTLIELVVFLFILLAFAATVVQFISGEPMPSLYNDTIIEIDGQTMQCTPITNLDDF